MSFKVMYFKMPEDSLSHQNMQHLLTKLIQLCRGWWQNVCRYLMSVVMFKHKLFSHYHTNVFSYYTKYKSLY